MEVELRALDMSILKPLWKLPVVTVIPAERRERRTGSQQLWVATLVIRQPAAEIPAGWGPGISLGFGTHGSCSGRACAEGEAGISLS